MTHPDESPQAPQAGKMRPLPIGRLVGLVVVGFALGWVILQLLNRTTMTPSIGWLTPVVWGILAVVLGVLARSMHVRIQVRRERVEPQWAVTCLALARAAAVAGALFAGGYAAWAVRFGNDIRFGAPTHRVWVCGVSAVIAVGAVVAGLLLERACRVPKDDDSND